MFQKIKDRIRKSMGMKFVATLSVWVIVLMMAGTFIVARMMIAFQERSLEARGREIGAVLAKAALDRLASSDILGLNLLVGDVVQGRDILAVVFTGTDGAPLTSAHASFNAEDPGVKKVLAAEKSEDVKRLLAAVRQELDPVEASVDVSLGGTRLAAIHLAFSRAEIRGNAANIVLLLAATSLVTVLTISTLVYFMVRRMIAAPTAEAEAVATSIAAGDLTQNVRVNTVDEIGELGRGLNQMVIGLKEMVGSVRESSGKLETVSGEVAGVAANIGDASRVQSESVEEASSSVNEMHFSLKEIAGNVEDLNETSEQTSSAVIETAASIDEVARLMTDLSSSIEETSTAITQMSAAVRQIAGNVETLSTAADETAASTSTISASVREVEARAKQSTGLADAVTADARDLGMRSIEKTIEGMRRIEDESRRSADVINRLGGRAENIGGILTVIEDITDQTGLLALNAAILAAQAGEHGKGFAVVAAQIRELANRTAASTQEIGTLITSVQEDSREAVEVMRNGVLMAEAGTRLAQEAGDALRKIVDRADQSGEMSRSISRAAAEQVMAMGQVNEAVDRINEMAHQIARATTEQRAGSEQIMRAAEKMRDITRFVRTATAEQVKASKNITVSVENMGAKVGLMNRAASEVRTGSDLIVKAIERIKSTARENAALAARLNSAVDVLTAQSGVLKREIDRFTT
ncbi:MAG: methyl-accepting chemotaxis sensory transducer [Nitrospirae bacterium]|nr:methyl-accepting chemotaxis sensory transducer [Nitrospirota bacterium]